MSDTTPTTGSLVWRLSMKWRAAVDRAVAPLGLTHAQFVVLASLYGLARRGTRPSQRELADFTGLEPVYVSRLAKALESSGMINRTDAPHDPRPVRLTLTDHGVDIAVQAVAAARNLPDQPPPPPAAAAPPRNTHPPPPPHPRLPAT